MPREESILWCDRLELCRIVNPNFAEFLFRDCPKRVRGACPVALQSTKTALFDPFLPPSTSKFALRALFVPLFGQSLEVEFSEVRGYKRAEKSDLWRPYARGASPALGTSWNDGLAKLTRARVHPCVKAQTVNTMPTRNTTNGNKIQNTWVLPAFPVIRLVHLNLYSYSWSLPSYS